MTRIEPHKHGPHRHQLMGVWSHIERAPQWDFGSRASLDFHHKSMLKEHGGRAHSYGGTDLYKPIGYSMSSPSLRGLGGPSGNGGLQNEPDPSSYKVSDKQTARRSPAFGFGTTARGGPFGAYRAGHESPDASPGPAAYNCQKNLGGARYSMGSSRKSSERSSSSPAPGAYGDYDGFGRGNVGPKWGSAGGGSRDLGLGLADGNGSDGVVGGPGPGYNPKGLGDSQGGFSMGMAPSGSKAVPAGRNLSGPYTVFGHYGR